MYGPTTQCNIKIYYQLSAYVSNLCRNPKSSLFNRLITDRLLVNTNRHSDVTSTHQ